MLEARGLRARAASKCSIACLYSRFAAAVRPSPVLCRGQTWLQCQRPCKERLGLAASPLIQIRVPKPHERRHIVRANLQRTLEGRGGFLRIAFQPVHVRKVIRPARLVRREFVRIEKAGLSGGEGFGGEQEPAQFAVRRRAICRR